MIFFNAVLEKHQSDVCSVNINVRVFVRVELLTAVEEFMCKRLPLTNSSIIMLLVSTHCLLYECCTCCVRSALSSGWVCVRACVCADCAVCNSSPRSLAGICDEAC